MAARATTGSSASAKAVLDGLGILAELEEEAQAAGPFGVQVEVLCRLLASQAACSAWIDSGAARLMAAGQGWEVPAHGQRAGPFGPGHVELAAAAQRPGEGRWHAVTAQAERPGGVAQRKGEAVGVGFEPGCHPAQQPDGRRARHAEPEVLDVGRPGIKPSWSTTSSCQARISRAGPVRAGMAVGMMSSRWFELSSCSFMLFRTEVKWAWRWRSHRRAKPWRPRSRRSGT